MCDNGRIRRRHRLRTEPEGDEAPFRRAIELEARAKEAPAWVALAAHLRGVHERHHPELGRVTEASARRRDGLPDEVGRLLRKAASALEFECDAAATEEDEDPHPALIEHRALTKSIRAYLAEPPDPVDVAREP